MDELKAEHEPESANSIAPWIMIQGPALTSPGIEL